MENTQSNFLEQTWRWYGPDDPVSLSDALQAGVQGIVTALHHISVGEIWTLEEIQKRQALVKSSGMYWSVIESLAIHEDIKTRSGDYGKYLDNYKQSLKNIGSCGIDTLCYNVMPIVDWTRTALNRPFKDGSTCLDFDYIDFVVFDIYLLDRDQATLDYDGEILSAAEERWKNLSKIDKDNLRDTICAGLPGADQQVGLTAIKNMVSKYADLSREDYQNNIREFILEVLPVAEENGIKMCVHPDDPPINLMGTERIMSSMQDVVEYLDFYNSPNHGITLCTGSFGGRPDNNLPLMIDQFGDRIHFVHLRNVKRYGINSFFEDNHLDGDVPMVDVMVRLVELTENRKSKRPLPFRPDHGHRMLSDLNQSSNPGYSGIGRLRGLAELRGLELGIRSNRN